jgi:site-specific recombinase XerD/ribosomal protein L40E
VWNASADIYNYRRTLDKALHSLENLNEENKLEILRFYHDCVAEGLSQARIIKYIVTLRRIANILAKPFSQVTKEDIASFVERIESASYSNWTKRDYKIVLKKFFKWFRKTEDYPEEVKWIKAKIKNNSLLPEELLCEEDINKLVEASHHPRDKALIQVLYESGCRIGELLSLKIRNVQFDVYGAVLLVNGKTGQRRVRIVASSPALATWINNHPLRENPDSPLWIGLATRNRNKVLTYTGAKELLKRIAKKAGIKKRIYPHLFRHSRATKLANALTESQLKQYLGWVQHSNMASTYVHLSGRDVDKALLRLNGIPMDEEEGEEQFKVKICPRCQVKNSPTAKLCDACGLALEVKAAVEIDETRAKVDKLMNELIRNPKVLDALLESIENLKKNS